MGIFVRVLVVSDLWPPFPGGAERLMFNLARDLMRRGFVVQVLTGYEQPQQFDGPGVARADIGLDDGWFVIESMIRAFEPDVIVTHHLYAFTFERQLIDCGVPFVQVVLNGRRIPEAAFAVYITEWVRDRVGGAGPDDFVLTPPALDDVVADEHGYAIGFVKPIPHKGVETLYRIARRMRERQFVVLRGEWQDLEVIKPLRNVEFLEPVDDIRDFYKRCSIVLMPSLSEDAGTVAQEATLNGLPCISSNVEGLNETNAGGIRLDPLDVPEWVDAIRSLDDRTVYEWTVERQRACLRSLDHAGGLARFAASIERVTRT